MTEVHNAKIILFSGKAEQRCPKAQITIKKGYLSCANACYGYSDELNNVYKIQEVDVIE